MPNATLRVGDARTIRADLQTQSYASSEWGDWTDATVASATVLVYEVGAEVTGTVDSGTASTVVDADLSETDDFYNGLVLEFTSGSNEGERRKISDYAGATGTVTLTVTTDPLPATPAADDTFRILGYPIVSQQDLATHDDGNVSGAAAYFQMTSANGCTATPRTVRVVIASSWAGADSNTDTEAGVWTYDILPVT